MTEYRECDVLVLGGGFGGCLTAMILQGLGISTAVAEQGRHPRFAIGESSTPAADLLLARLCEQYGLQELRPLTTYGQWKSALPQLGCGLKRGFSYFSHQTGSPFRESRLGEQQLLVAASGSDQSADTHWLRSDVDAFFADCLRRRGIFWRDECRLDGARLADGWRWHGQTAAGPLEIKCRFVVDGTGPRGVIPNMLGITPLRRFETHSSALYGHFVNVARWGELLPDRAAHPFDCDAAAIHHILAEGWMWQLRFDDGRVSCGLVFDDSESGSTAVRDRTASPAECWQRVVQRYPSLATQFAQAECVAPAGGLVRTSRLQRRWQLAAGPDWLLLPSTAGFVDPLHSTGIAHTMMGVTRLAELFERHWQRGSWADAWLDYDRPLRQEFEMIDRLVAGCYRARSSFPLLVSFLMLYFAAATTWEQSVLSTDHCEPAGRSNQPGGNERLLKRMPFPDGQQSGGAWRTLFLADDARFRATVEEAWQRLCSIMPVASAAPDSRSVSEFEAWIRQVLAPYNSVGLCDNTVDNMYRYTAVGQAG